ncbi:MAG: hypothetical protein WBC97_07075 [Gemmatimonadales bacterium]
MTHRIRLAPLVIGTLLAACATTPAKTTPVPTAITAIEQMSGTNALLIGLSPVNDQVVWASGTGGTWLRTTDGGTTWQHGTVPGGEFLQFRDVQGVDANTAWLMSAGTADTSRIYVTHDAGATWTLTYTNPDLKGFYDCMDFWDARRGLVIGDAVDATPMILATSDAGARWARLPATALPSAVPGEGSFAASGTCLITRPHGHAWIAVGTPTAKLLHTTDYGRSWTTDSIPLIAISSVSFRDIEHGIVLGTDSSAATASTSDGGMHWLRGAPPPFAQGFYGGVYVHNARRPVVVAGGPGGLAWSRDDGASWTVIDHHIFWSVASASPRATWAVGARGRIVKLSGF